MKIEKNPENAGAWTGDRSFIIHLNPLLCISIYHYDIHIQWSLSRKQLEIQLKNIAGNTDENIAKNTAENTPENTPENS